MKRLIRTIRIIAIDTPPTISYLSVSFVVTVILSGILKAFIRRSIGIIYFSTEMKTLTDRTAHSFPMNSVENSTDDMLILNIFKIQTINSPPIPSIKK